jgi:WD40 repeat protein
LLLLTDNTRVACSARTGQNFYIAILELNDFKYQKAFTGHFGYITSIVNISGKRIASSSRDTTVKIWDTVEGIKCVKELAHEVYVSALNFCERDNLLFSGSGEMGMINIWNMTDFKCIKTILNENRVECLRLLANGFFASGDTKGRIKIWDMNTYRCVEILERVGFCIWFLLLLKDNRLLSVSHGCGELISWGYSQ